MKRKLYILHAILSAIIYFSLLSSAIGGEKSVIIKFHQPPGPSEQALIHGAKGIIKRAFRLIPAMAVSLPEEEIVNIKKNNKIAYIEDDSIVTAVEPLIGEEYANSWGVLHIGSDVAHAGGNKGLGVKIAVLDTGIDYTHEDLDGNFKGGDNFVEYITPPVDPHDPFDDSYNSHGTHVAGIIAAEQNGVGVVGVAPEAELYAVKVLDGSGHGLTSWIISGIEWAVENKMDIVNLSIEGTDSQPLKDACDEAYNAGVLLVAAAGNINGGPVTYPAAYDSVVAVTGTDASDMQAWFSPVGLELELAAPGVNVMSTVRGGGYEYLSGTSQAAPHVTGTAALIISSNLIEDLNGDGIVNNVDVRLKLQMTAIDLGKPWFDEIYGFGLVNAAASLPINEPIDFTITRISQSPATDAVTVSLSTGAVYIITIKNNGLNKVDVAVFDGEVFVKESSSSYHFGDKKPQEVSFHIDATMTAYDIIFTPYGKAGGSANILIMENYTNALNEVSLRGAERRSNLKKMGLPRPSGSQ